MTGAGHVPMHILVNIGLHHSNDEVRAIAHELAALRNTNAALLLEVEGLKTRNRLLAAALNKARPFVAWHTQPYPSDVKRELREIDAALSPASGGV